MKSYITETHDNWHKGYINPFWTLGELSKLNYTKKKFNNQTDLIKWNRAGYVIPPTHFTGMLCDMNENHPAWTNDFTEWFAQEYNVTDVGVSYYKMDTCNILPTHSDTYKTYVNLFDTSIDKIVRAVVFLDNWHSGHVFEIDGNPITNWVAGDFVVWFGDVEHMAANIGVKSRYTMQLTGHKQ